MPFTDPQTFLRKKAKDHQEQLGTKRIQSVSNKIINTVKKNKKIKDEISRWNPVLNIYDGKSRYAVILFALFVPEIKETQAQTSSRQNRHHLEPIINRLGSVWWLNVEASPVHG